MAGIKGTAHGEPMSSRRRQLSSELFADAEKLGKMQGETPSFSSGET